MFRGPSQEAGRFRGAASPYWGEMDFLGAQEGRTFPFMPTSL